MHGFLTLCLAVVSAQNRISVEKQSKACRPTLRTVLRLHGGENQGGYFLESPFSGLGAEEVLHEEIRLNNMEFHDDSEADSVAPYGRGYYYKCPCGDLFFITPDELESGERIARCPSCTLVVRIID
mmetsp:Transcript_19367/g.39213  ORF Transcript_19367/g.39213 Transcript_19367/m.39213 type:complete len:126 (-) Transcript_19367:7-384(-)